MKKFILCLFVFAFFTTAFAAPKRYKLLHSTTDWFNATNWSPAGLPSNGDTVTIPANIQLNLSYDLTFSDFYFDIYGSLLLSGNNMKMILQNSSTLNLHTSGWINGSKASQQIVMGNSIIYKGNAGLLTGAMIATSTSNSLAPYIENSILPVKFVSFTVARSQSGFVAQWVTADEKNAAYYEVQRSANSTNWETIASVSALGKTTNNYTFTDKNCVGQVLYYRIKQVDADGIFTYTNVCQLKNENANRVAIQAAQSSVQVYFSRPVTGKVVVEVIRMNGTVAFTQTLTNPSGLMPVATANLHGIYIVHVRSNQAVNTAQQLFL